MLTLCSISPVFSVVEMLMKQVFTKNRPVPSEEVVTRMLTYDQCDQKKSPKIYKSCPKMISLENDRFLTPLQKLPKNV